MWNGRDAYGWQMDGCRLARLVRVLGEWGLRWRVPWGTAALVASSSCCYERTRDAGSAPIPGRTSLHTTTQQKARKISHKGSNARIADARP